MNHPSSRRTSSRSSLRRSHIALSFALVCGLFAGGTQAQVIISDPPGFIKQGLQLEQEVQSAANTYAQLQNILMQAQSLGSNISLFDKPLQPITNSGPMIASACPGAGGGLVGDALNAISSALNANASVASRQQMICAQIVVYEVDEYNKTVTALNTIGSVSTTTMAKLNGMISSVSTLGTASNTQLQTAGVDLSVKTAMDIWQTQVKADDAIIGALQKQQSILAKVAMNGNPTLLGTLVQATALKAAFTINQ